MKKLVILFSLLSVAIVAFSENGTLFVDPLTNVSCVFPEGTNIDSTLTKLVNDSNSNFVKCVAIRKGGYISLASKKNKKNRPFSWEEVNRYDANDRFGRLVAYEKAREDLEGWIRTYEYTDSNKRLQKCYVTLIRYNRYAIYMVEDVGNEKSITKDVVNSMKFPKSTKIQRTTAIDWIIIVGIILLGFVVWLLRKYITNKPIKWCMLVVSLIVLVVYILLKTNLGIGALIGLGLLNSFVWSLVLWIDDWSELGGIFVLILENIF